jgi:hypothetical protein
MLPADATVMAVAAVVTLVAVGACALALLAKERPARQVNHRLASADKRSSNTALSVGRVW